MKVATFEMRLNKVLESKGISRSELSKRTGLSRQMLYKYQSGLANPRDKNVELIAKATGVDVTYLLGYDVDEQGNSSVKYHADKEDAEEIKMINMAIGQALEMLRVKKHKTINDVAELLNRKPTLVVSYEQGTEPTPSATVLRLCYLLNYDIGEFYQDVLFFYKKISSK